MLTLHPQPHTRNPNSLTSLAHSKPHTPHLQFQNETSTSRTPRLEASPSTPLSRLMVSPKDQASPESANPLSSVLLFLKGFNLLCFF